MNKNNKIYLIILAVLIILFLLTKIDTKTERIISFFKVDSLDVIKFSLEDANGLLMLEKQGGTWQITEPIEYPADQTNVRNLLEKTLTAETSKLPLSESESSLPNYELQDSLAVSLMLYGKNDKILDAAYFGKMKGQAKTPARKKDSFKVHLLSESLNYYMKADPQTWRDKTVAAIDKESIEKISILYDDIGFELTRGDTAWFYEDGENSLVVKDNNSALSTIFSSLRRITSTQFKDNEYEKYEEILTKPDLEIAVITLDGKATYLRLAREDDKNYVMQKDSKTKTLFVQYESWVKRFFKTFEDFKE